VPFSAIKVIKSEKKFSDIQWDMLSTLKSLLEPFEAAIVFITGEKYVTASTVVAIIHALHAKMEPAPDDGGNGGETKCYY